MHRKLKHIPVRLKYYRIDEDADLSNIQLPNFAWKIVQLLESGLQSQEISKKLQFFDEDVISIIGQLENIAVIEEIPPQRSNYETYLKSNEAIIGATPKKKPANSKSAIIEKGTIRLKQPKKTILEPAPLPFLKTETKPSVTSQPKSYTSAVAIQSGNTKSESPHVEIGFK